MTPDGIPAGENRSPDGLASPTETEAQVWADRYRRGETPWDLGTAHPELLRRIDQLGPPGTAIVPGAGHGHDAAALAAAGWAVTAVEIVPELATPLSTAIGDQGTVVIADALTYRPPTPVDMVFDHTFFCALPLHDRQAFGDWVTRVVRPGGRLASVVFPVAPALPDGPPYGMSADALVSVLAPAYILELDEPALDGGRTSWPTRFAVLRRHRTSSARHHAPHHREEVTTEPDERIRRKKHPYLEGHAPCRCSD